MRIALALLVGLAACTPPTPVTAPAPVTITTPLAPAAVVRVAVQTLAGLGFTPTVSDASGGVVVATKAARTADEMRSLFACPWKPSAIGWKLTTGELAVTVTAAPRGDSANVSVVSASHGQSTADAGLLATKEWPCASNGSTEAAVTAALRRETASTRD